VKKYIKEILFLIQGDNLAIARLVLFFLLSSIMDLIGIGLIIPFISLITDSEGIKVSELSNALANLGYVAEPKEIIILSGISIIFIFLTKATISILVFRSILDFCHKQGVNLRSSLMKSYQSLPYTDFIQRDSSKYIYRVNNAVELFLREILQPFLRSISEGLTIIFIFILLAWFDFRALFMLLVLLGSAGLIYDLLFREKLYGYGKMVNDYSTRIVKNVSESVNGYKEIKVYDKEEYFHDIVKKASLKYAKASKNSEIIANMPRYIWEVIIIIFIVLLSFIALFYNQLQSFFITIGLFGVAAVRLIPSSSSLINGISKLRHGRDTVNLIFDDLTKNQKYNPVIEDISLKYSEFESLCLKNVEFKYPKSAINSVQNLSMDFRKGQTIGITGPSGSGKTTIVDIILGFLNHTSGEIYYNGELVDSSQKKWQSRIAYLPQNAFIISDSIKNNITFGINDCDVDQIALNKSIHDAQLYKVIDKLPHGIDTTLGEGGVNLSGGEMQRISIARALYQNRDILIMDESTSALDKENEKNIMKVIEKFKKDKAIIIISHSFSVLKFADIIYMIENGSIKKSGTYSEIIH